MKEWKEIQNEVDEGLFSLSVKHNKPPSYSPKCGSDDHIKSRSSPCHYCKDQDPDKLRNDWTKYMEDTEENLAKRSKIVRYYTSSLFNIYNTRNPVEF